MTRQEQSDTAPDEEHPTSGIPDWLAVVILTEAAILLIALVVPVTPSKTGSEWSPASYFWADPGYLHEVAVTFVGLHFLVAVLGLLAWLTMRKGGHA